MSIASVKRPIKTMQKPIDVSRNTMKHSLNLAGKPLAEIEIAPYEDLVVALGIYKEGHLPKGFCMQYDTENPDLVRIEITSNKVFEGYLYVLHITNNSNQVICVEVKSL